MPPQRQINVLSDLKNLSDEVDQVAQDCIKGANITEWVDVCQQVIVKIRDCSSVEELQAVHYPDTIILVSEAKKEKADGLVGLQIEKIHKKKEITVPNEVIEDTKILSAVVKLTPCDNVTVLKGPDTATKENKLMPSLLLKKSNENSSDEKYNEKIITPLRISYTKDNPVVQLKKIETLVNLDGTFVKHDSEGSKLKSHPTSETPIVNRTFNKTTVETAIDSVQKSKLLKEKNGSSMLIISGSEKNTIPTLENYTSNAKRTHSKSKRKSSASNNESNKKQKMNGPETPVVTANKTAKSKHPVLKKNNSKSALVSTPKNKSKVSAVIVPPAQTKTSRVSKEQHILEEIKRKEEKTKLNIKRVQAERQEKAELTKKTQEVKRQKALEKRMQMKKEKEERLKKESAGIKLAKEYAENPVKKAKTQDATENHGKEKKSVVSNPVKQNNSNVDDAGFKTPKAKKSDDYESYELTPMPNSSTYNFSDDEDDKPAGKPIPLWAQGLHLKSALIQQFYSAVDPRSIFGSRIDSPNLVQIFNKDKKTYKKRTSSAFWNSRLESSFNC